MAASTTGVRVAAKSPSVNNAHPRRRPSSHRWGGRIGLLTALWLVCLPLLIATPARAAWMAGPRHSVVVPPPQANRFKKDFMKALAPRPVPDSPTAQGAAATPLLAGHKELNLAAVLKPTEAESSYLVRTGSDIRLSGWRTWSRTLKGMEFNLNPGGALTGQRLLLFGGAVADDSGDYATGLSWVNHSSDGRVLGLDLLYNARAENEGLDGQWVARMGGGLNLPSPFAESGLRLEGEFATMRDGGAQDDFDSGASGGFLRLSRAPGADGGFFYGLTARRYGRAFTPIGGNQPAGQEALEIHANYHFSSGMQLRARSLFAINDYGTDDPLMVQESGVGLFGALLPWLFDDMSASLETFYRDRRDYSGSQHFRTTGLDLKLHQALAMGWRTRFGMAVAWDQDLLNDTSTMRRQFSFSGRHRLHFGRYTGSIGPGVAWRRSGSLEVGREFEAGVALELAGYMHSLRLDMDYLARELGPVASLPEQSFQAMLSYHLWLDASEEPAPGNGWHQLRLADGF